jgi:hypothetical protein
MTIRTLQYIQDVDLADNMLRAITPLKLRNFADSVMAVGGSMYCNNATLDVTTSWAAIAEYTNSVDTKGVTENLANGTYTIDAGADGAYMVSAMICIDSPNTGDLDLAITKNGVLTPYQVTYTAIANQKMPFPIFGGGVLAEGDEIAVAIKGQGNVTVDLIHASLRLSRV